MAEKMESAEDYKSPAGMAQRWGKELESAEKELKEFHEASKNVVRAYLDKRDAFDEAQSRINVFWSNTQVLKATLYAKPPKVDVSRTHRDEDDDVARVAGTILERVLNNDVEKDGSPFDEAARQGIEDWLIVAMGQMWLRYEVQTEQAQTEPVMGPDGQSLVQPMSYEVITHEDAVSEYVFWGDFLWSPARTWSEVRWVARKVYMTRDALTKRFGEKIGRAVPMLSKKSDGGPQNNPWQTACVYEIWCKENRTVYWWCKGMETVLDYKADPLGLTDFFPCPCPLVGNITTSNFMPRADYTMAQDLYRQINDAQTRLKYLVRACRVSGVYDKNTPELRRLLDENRGENELVPVDNWAMLGEKGGLRGVTDFVPIEMIVNVIVKLREDISASKAELYEVLGIADIMRGSSDSGETATAQQIKAQYGSTRLQFKQFEVARWVRDCLRLKAEIVCKHFQAETIIERSGIGRSVDAPLAEQAVELLKSEGTLGYRVTVEADSMAAMDWASERDARGMFMDSIGRYVTSISPLLESQPQSAPLLLKLLQWGLGGFRVGKQIESVIDQAIQQVEQGMAQPEEPQEDPRTVIEREKLAMQERIAEANNDSKERVAALNATIESLKLQMQNEAALMGERFSHLQQMVDLKQQHAAEGEQRGREMQDLGSRIDQNMSTLQQALQQAQRPRRRVPVRDPDTGDLMEIREEFFDPMQQPER